MNVRLPYPHLIASVPSGILALSFLVTWFEPEAIGAGMHRYFVTVMLLEFIIIHSAAFMGWALFTGSTMLWKILRVIGLGSFYSLFVIAFTFDSGEWWPLAAFWLLILNRIMSFLSGDAPVEQRQSMMGVQWAWSVFWYIAAVAVTVMLPLPEFGWSRSYIATLPHSGSGLWFDTPQSLIAAGFIYYSSIAFFEWYSPRIQSTITAANGGRSIFRKRV